DLLRENGGWSNRLASKYRVPVRDALALRRNAYRVLLSRGRDGSIIFVPDDRQFDVTASFLLDCGVQLLSG
ncbi:MAG: DNA/RNA helicase domain-containing protein, partial [Planctomycetia bacterium]